MEKQNIGVVNAIFNQNLQELLLTKKGKKAIKEYVETIKSDKNLLLTYKLFDYVENIAKTKEQVIESLNLIKHIT